MIRLHTELICNVITTENDGKQSMVKVGQVMSVKIVLVNSLTPHLMGACNALTYDLLLDHEVYYTQLSSRYIHQIHTLTTLMMPGGCRPYCSQY